MVEPLKFVRDIITTTDRIVYQWSKEPNMEVLMLKHTSTALTPSKSYKKTSNPLHRVTLV